MCWLPLMGGSIAAVCRHWLTNCSEFACWASELFWSVPAPSAPAWAGLDWAAARPTCGSFRPAPRSARMLSCSFTRNAWLRHGVNSAQILLTAGDFDNRARYLNVRNTILTLFEWGCLADHQ